MSRILPLLIALALAFAGNALAETIELKNGDKVTGEVIERDEERVVIESPVLGRLEIPVEEIKPPKREKPGLFGTRFLAGWKREVSAGFSGSNGENSDVSITANGTLEHEDDMWKGIYRANYFLARENGNTSDNKLFLDMLESRRFKEGSRWRITGDARWDYDEKQAWKHRLAFHVGPGYEIFRREHLFAVLRIGAGGNQTLRGEQDWQTEGLIGLVARWNITKNLRLRFNNSVLPVLDDLPEWRNITSASLNLSIPELGGLGVSTGIENEYDSSRSTDKNDLKYFGRLVYAF